MGQECVSCFYPKIEIANFKKRGGNNATLILFVYPTSTAHAVLHKVYTTAWGICFSVHSLHGVWRYQIFDELDKSLRFSCIYNQAQIIYADFGRLVGTKTFSDDEVVLSFG